MNDGLWAFADRPCCSDAQLCCRYIGHVWRQNAAPKFRGGATSRPVGFLLGLMFARTNGSSALAGVRSSRAEKQDFVSSFNDTWGFTSNFAKRTVLFITERQLGGWRKLGEKPQFDDVAIGFNMS